MTIPFLCVAVAWLLVYYPRGFVLLAQIKRPEGLDNVDPRAQQAKLEGRAARANAAHNNAFEGFAPFAAAVLVAHLAEADATWSTYLAIGYCVVRLVYPLIYMAGLGSLRTATWCVGMGCTAGLFALPLL